jgi:hypothetical protein
MQSQSSAGPAAIMPRLPSAPPEATTTGNRSHRTKWGDVQRAQPHPLPCVLQDSGRNRTAATFSHIGRWDSAPDRGAPLGLRARPPPCVRKEQSKAPAGRQSLRCRVAVAPCRLAPKADELLPAPGKNKLCDHAWGTRGGALATVRPLGRPQRGAGVANAERRTPNADACPTPAMRLRCALSSSVLCTIYTTPPTHTHPLWAWASGRLTPVHV